MDSPRIQSIALATILAIAPGFGFQDSVVAQENPPPAVTEPAPVGSESAAQSAAQSAPRSGNGTIDNLGLIALGSIVIAGFTIALGSIAPALGEGRAVAQALSAIAQQPDSSNTITRTLFVGLAMIESTAIYCFVVSMIMLFANPFWNYFIQ